MVMLITIQLFDTFYFFSHPWLLGLLGFPLTLQIQAKTKNSKIEFNLGSPRFKSIP